MCCLRACVGAVQSTQRRHSHFGSYETTNREELRWRDEVATDQIFDDFANADANADTDTTEVIDDEEMVQLVSGAQEESEDVNDPDTSEDPVPTPSQVMHAVDVLRRFAEACKGAEDSLTSLGQLRDVCAPVAHKRAPV